MSYYLIYMLFNLVRQNFNFNISHWPYVCFMPTCHFTLNVLHMLLSRFFSLVLQTHSHPDIYFVPRRSTFATPEDMCHSRREGMLADANTCQTTRLAYTIFFHLLFLACIFLDYGMMYIEYSGSLWVPICNWSEPRYLGCSRRVPKFMHFLDGRPSFKTLGI